MHQYREARQEDRVALQELIKEYCAEAGLHADDEYISKYISVGLANFNVLVATEEDKVIGVISFMVSKHHFTGIPCGRKIAWFISKEHRGKAGLKLLKMAENRARELGAKHFYCSTPTKLTTDYMPLEVEYRKELV